VTRRAGRGAARQSGYSGRRTTPLSWFLGARTGLRAISRCVLSFVCCLSFCLRLRSESGGEGGASDALRLAPRVARGCGRTEKSNRIKVISSRSRICKYVCIFLSSSLRSSPLHHLPVRVLSVMFVVTSLVFFLLISLSSISLVFISHFSILTRSLVRVARTYVRSLPGYRCILLCSHIFFLLVGRVMERVLEIWVPVEFGTRRSRFVHGNKLESDAILGSSGVP
jgi:hypothetical protein